MKSDPTNCIERESESKLMSGMDMYLSDIHDKELLAQMEVFAQKFSDLKKAIENKDEEKIKEMMKISTVRRKYFDK